MPKIRRTTAPREVFFTNIDGNKGCLLCIEEQKARIEELPAAIMDTHADKSRLLLNYPVIYIHFWQKSKSDTSQVLFRVYVGESNDVIERTKQHYAYGKDNTKWQKHLINPQNNPLLLLIGHEHFNKSLTLDIENRLIHYISSMATVDTLYNGRGNPQKMYYPDDELEPIFSSIWKELHGFRRDLFLSEKEIHNSAIYKASPFHKLTIEQLEAKNKIIEKILTALSSNENNILICVEGEAGTGKTVLTSSTFFELITNIDPDFKTKPKCHLIVNHEEQVTVYQEIARKLNISDYQTIVSRPTAFINSHSETNKVDIAFIDEGHLLWTQGNQGYNGHNQLDDIRKRARVTVLMFDKYQILSRLQYLDSDDMEGLRSIAQKKGYSVTLQNQLRMIAGPDVIRWIDNITKQHVVEPLGLDTKEYILQVLDSPEELYKTIKAYAEAEDSRLSRIVATYDWPYDEKKQPPGEKHWSVKIGSFIMPWNRELWDDISKQERKKMKNMAWAEQPHTIDEIGSTFTIQGFDLSYAGLIIGPSVTYRNGKICFDPTKSCNKKAVEQRTVIVDGKKQKLKLAEELLSHELRVLMTRGVKGLYIYACDDELREALKKSLEL